MNSNTDKELDIHIKIRDQDGNVYTLTCPTDMGLTLKDICIINGSCLWRNGNVCNLSLLYFKRHRTS